MTIVRTIIAVAGFALGASVCAQSYPSRPVTILNGFPPGGPTDTVLRLIGSKLSDRLGQAVVVENRAGASGTIAGAPWPAPSRTVIRCCSGSPRTLPSRPLP